MKFAPIALCAAALICTALPSQAKIVSGKEQARAQAERACYLDAKALCPDAIPDEEKIKACMAVHRLKLSPKCREVFDAGAR